MENTTYEEIRNSLNDRDIALLSKKFLKSLEKIATPKKSKVHLNQIARDMRLGAYNLDLVLPFIIDNYLEPHDLVNKRGDEIRLTKIGRKVLMELDRDDLDPKQVLNVIQNKRDSNGEMSALIIDLTEELREFGRPRLFVDIYPQKTNLLDLVLRNSGGGPAYDIDCKFDPDLPYADNFISNLKIFRNLQFLEKGQEIRLVYGSILEVTQRKEYPKRTNVSLWYRDSKFQKYEESYEIDLERYLGTLIHDSYSISDLHKDLQDIRRQLDDFQRTGVLVKTQSDLDRERERYQEFLKQQQSKKQK